MSESPADTSGSPDTTPDARTDPEIDEVRGADAADDVDGEVETQYSLRSMSAQPNPTDDDPASYLNM